MIDLEWLGVGQARFGIYNEGRPIIAHAIDNSNDKTEAYMSTANLPVRYEIEATSTLTGTRSLKQICTAVTSEGGFDERKLVFSADRGTQATVVTSGTTIPVIAMRVSTVFPAGGSITNRETVSPTGFEIYTEDGPVLYELVHGGTVEGGEWDTVDGTHSGVEVNTTAGTVTGGVVIASGYVPAQAKSTGGQSQIAGFQTGDVATDLTLNTNFDATVGDTFAVRCTAITSTASDTWASLTWKEFY